MADGVGTGGGVGEGDACMARGVDRAPDDEGKVVAGDGDGDGDAARLKTVTAQTATTAIMRERKRVIFFPPNVVAAILPTASCMPCTALRSVP